ncbi:MAG TPA: cytochrome c-type biogenesis protein CcmH [Solirubrobacteraceae bacterium]|jgi:cytochrome c-type biogenesis protein CcmH|nr:cytochrome c-type biogenesis protein CcmH [Solirubrobacteraceae bacterium]
MSGRLVALAAALLLTAPSASALAAAGCPKTSLADVENEVMCLVCGVPLALADAPQAQRERVFVTRMVDQCKSKDQIKAALVAQYGPRVLALPTPSGFRLAAYLVPALAAAVAAAGVALAAARWRRHRRPSRRDMIPDQPPLDPLQAARIDAELERYRQ